MAWFKSCQNFFKSSISIWVICLSALVFTTLMALIAIWIEQAYFEHHSYFYDPVSYLVYNARLYTRLADEGPIPLALNELDNNIKFPLRTVPLILFAPNLLAHPMGHLATVLPMFFVFLLLLGWTIYHRTGYLLYGIACMALFCAMPIMFDPRYGLGAYWLDWPAAFLVAGAGLCLLNSSGARDWKWLAGFAALASLAVLCRYISSGFTFAICVPILVYYLIQRWRKEGGFVKPVLLPLGVIIAVSSILAGPFFISGLQRLLIFNSTFRYDSGHDFATSARFVFRALFEKPSGLSAFAFVSRPLIVVLSITGIVNLALWWRGKTRNSEELIVSFWAAIAVILFLIFVVGNGGAWHPLFYTLLFPFFFAVSPASLSEKRLSRPWLKVLSGVLITVALLLGGKAAVQNYDLATHPPSGAQELKAFDIALAQELCQTDKPVVWNAYFDEYAWIPSMEAFFRYGKFPLPVGQDKFFTIHESHWVGNYPNLTAEEMAEDAYKNTNKWVDIAVVFDDPAVADQHFNNEYSGTVARYIAKTIREDKRWEKLFTIESKRYGILAGYSNKQPIEDNYKGRIEGKPI